MKPSRFGSNHYTLTSAFVLKNHKLTVKKVCIGDQENRNYINPVGPSVLFKKRGGADGLFHGQLFRKLNVFQILGVHVTKCLCCGVPPRQVLLFVPSLTRIMPEKVSIRFPMLLPFLGLQPGVHYLPQLVFSSLT